MDKERIRQIAVNSGYSSSTFNKDNIKLPIDMYYFGYELMQEVLAELAIQVANDSVDMPEHRKEVFLMIVDKVNELEEDYAEMKAIQEEGRKRHAEYHSRNKWNSVGTGNWE